jgi:pimeloyl-ACP methyl ester carboxylesterase
MARESRSVEGGRFLDLPGLRMHVVEAGSGTPVVLVHGFPQSSREWSRVMPLLEPHARAIAPDLRGAGRSEAPDSPYRLDTMCGDLVELLDALSIEQAVVVGHDIGALGALALAMDRPERVSRLVVLSIPPMYVKLSPALLRSAPYSWYQYALAMPGLGERLLGGGGQRLPRWLFSTSAVRGGASERDREAYIARLREPDRARAGSRTYRQLVVPELMRILRGGYRDRLPTMPTLVLYGADDPLVSRPMLEDVERFGPSIRIEELPGTGHWVVDEQPAEVARRILEFAELTPTA